MYLSNDMISSLIFGTSYKNQLTVEKYLKVSILCPPFGTLVITFQNRSLADLSPNFSWEPGYKTWGSGPVSKGLPFAGAIVTHLVHLDSASARCECEAIWRLCTCVKVKQKGVLIHLPIVLHWCSCVAPRWGWFSISCLSAGLEQFCDCVLHSLQLCFSL